MQRRNSEKIIPRYSGSELYLGDVLGHGSFCVVNEVLIINSPLARNLDEKTEIVKKKIMMPFKFHGRNKFNRIISVPQSRPNSNQPEFAIKRLRTDLEQTEMIQAKLDLSVEMKLLALMDHPNIIKVWGISKRESLHDANFLILDRLYGTLSQEIRSWRETERKIAFNRISWSKKKKMRKHWRDKLRAAFEISKAMKYLHEKKCVEYRIVEYNFFFCFAA
mmetsp:Transcript_12548/g.27730  ORF Transcript_12548/g.27730 Transcript_12548/m.27730 type:complete len:220 (+) Transcript_12548:239-898(+)